MRAAAPRTTQLLGISTGHAGQLLITAGQNIERLRNDGAFAALCGASPIPVSSGRRNRHRLNPDGDRDANRTLHMIAVVRLRYCQRSRANAQRRVTEGKTKPEIIRCLKRYIARETYHTLCADLADLAQQQPTPPTTAITKLPFALAQLVPLDLGGEGLGQLFDELGVVGCLVAGDAWWA
jgi:transposase